MFNICNKVRTCDKVIKTNSTVIFKKRYFDLFLRNNVDKTLNYKFKGMAAISFLV